MIEKFCLLLTLIAICTIEEVEAQPVSSAKGQLNYKGPKKDVNLVINSAQYVKGPDALDDTKKIRRLIFPSADLSKTVATCATMQCIESHMEGLQVDMVDGPRYAIGWF